MAPSKRKTATAGMRVVDVTPALVRRFRLKQPDSDDSKEERGRILIIGGSREVPGALRLAAEAALQVGGGKLHIATVTGVAPMLALLVPEARVTGLPATRSGEIRPSSAAQLQEFVAKSDAVLVGPGMLDPDNAARLVAGLDRNGSSRWIFDAAAIADFSTGKHPAPATPTVITPHHGEMLRLAKEIGVEAPKNGSAALAACAQAVARHCGYVTVLKGSTTWIADPGAKIYRHIARLPGLGTSGSGDVLAGLVAGLAARETNLLHCAVRAVQVHAQAGATLSRRRGAIGFLAREISREIPGLMHNS